MLEQRRHVNGQARTPASWADDVLRTLGPEERPSLPRLPRGKVVVVVAAVAGVGKTLVALNLASALASDGARRVALVDFDLKLGTIAPSLGLAPTRDVATALGALRLEDSGQLLTHLSWAPGGFEVLAAPGPDKRIADDDPDAFAKLLQALIDHYDFVVVDTPPALSGPTAAALE